MFFFFCPRFLGFHELSRKPEKFEQVSRAQLPEISHSLPEARKINQNFPESRKLARYTPQYFPTPKIILKIRFNFRGSGNIQLIFRASGREQEISGSRARETCSNFSGFRESLWTPRNLGQKKIGGGQLVKVSEVPDLIAETRKPKSHLR